eukprot:scaffold350920_cov50-Prasinocladus_malaysianus.AAC.1
MPTTAGIQHYQADPSQPAKQVAATIRTERKIHLNPAKQDRIGQASVRLPSVIITSPRGPAWLRPVYGVGLSGLYRAAEGGH